MATTEALIHPAVVAAVEAEFKHGRTFQDHFWYYLSAEQRMSFSNSAVAFNEACKARKRWLTQ